MTTDRPPDLRKLRLLLIRATDVLPPSGPAWHPTWRKAAKLRAGLLPLLAEVQAYLDASEKGATP